MMYPSYFTMNLLRYFLASWLIFMLVEEAVSLEEAVLHRVGYTSPLAVIKKQDSSLQLAIPHTYTSNKHLCSYNYDDSEDKNGPKEKLMIACPAHGEKQLQVEKNWKTGALATTDETKLLFLSEYKSLQKDAFCSSTDFTPSINKVEENSDDQYDHVKHCNQLHADMYEVGYSVSNDEEGKDIQFLSTYKICYSKTEGKEATLYSIHRIESPDLLFTDVIRELTDYQPLWPIVHKSVLDSSLSTKKSFEGKAYFKYKFVGGDDMPSRQWRQTTLLLFNNTAITRNEDLFKGMIRADWYIRLYSYKRNEQLNLYSGTHQKVIQDTPPVDSFWRVILDDGGRAIILVTQHTRKECGQDYLCGKNHQVKTYKEGGCIYTCSLDTNDNLLEVLGLPPLKITGELDFTLQTELFQRTGIIEFLDNKSFEDALLNIDKDIFRNADFQDASFQNAALFSRYAIHTELQKN
ncbi:uncharacterized protein LOC135847829 isoform X1 [Planococcus citri]|uniref:uncharacterized protein LOC135847829 isoform X1 n=1 Tax=Planococcus citri TaxID=170843 RepID=UPI0031F8A1BF